MNRLRSVVRGKSHEEMVQKLARNSADGSQTVFQTIRELLCFAAMLGFQKKKRSKIHANERGEDVMIEEFERVNAVDYIYCIAVAETGGMEILKADSEEDMVTIFEEYINGGLEILKGWKTKYNDEIGQRAILQGLKNEGFIDDDTVDLKTIMDSFEF